MLLFLADYQRWHDYFLTCDIEKFRARSGLTMRLPEEGDLMLACCDAVIAAQTAVIAAESLGVGSCYIGDIMENYEAYQAQVQRTKRYRRSSEYRAADLPAKIRR